MIRIERKVVQFHSWDFYSATVGLKESYFIINVYFKMLIFYESVFARKKWEFKNSEKQQKSRIKENSILILCQIPFAPNDHYN